MAAAKSAIKLTQIAKDFDLKTKEITDLFKEVTGVEKKSGSSFEGDEFEALLVALTKTHQIENLEDYKAGRAKLISEIQKPEKKAAPAPETPVEKPVPAESKPAAAPEEASVPVAPVEVAPAKETKPAAAAPEKPQTGNPPRPSAPAVRPATAPQSGSVARPAPQNTAGARPAAGQQRPARPQPNGQNGQNSQRTDRRDHGQRGRDARNGRPTGQVSQADIAKKMELFREWQAQKTAEEQVLLAKQKKEQDERRRQEAAERAAAEAAAKKAAEEAAQKPEKQVKPPVKKEQTDRFAQRPTAQPAQKPRKEKEEKRPHQQKTILTPMGASAGAGEIVVTQAPKTRIVDTRTTMVDLSRYDEKLDQYSGGNDHQSNRQKLKKQDNRQQNAKSAKDKDRLAQEKIKRMEMEKARKKQLEITVPDEITVSELASRLKKTSAEVIKKLMMMGVMASVNQTVDFDTAYLVAEELGAKVTREVVVTIEERLFEEAADAPESLQERAPVVCVMGHVDHGKTSLLDAIRHTHVTQGEAGGITQHIGAYRVNVGGKDITFLDTPGHEAFTAMRARGAQATDIAILVVAADDGIMPQTIEAINHAKSAGVDIIVAINKMDKPGANPDQVKQELTKYELVPEEWGGDVICVPVSALTGMGIDNLLESILLVAEVKELKANPNRHAKGLIIEAKLDRGRGPVATVLVQNGTLHQGDVVIAGTAVGRVRAMINDKGETVKAAGPSVPVEIVGLSEVPVSGDEFNAVEDEKMARSLAEQRREKQRQETFKANSRVNLDELFSQISEGTKKLDIIVKADVGGSAEAVKTSLLKLSTDEVQVNVIHAGVGGITEGDVMLASAANAIIVGFNVRPDKNALDSAERQGVDIRTYRIIYDCIEEISAALKGMLAPQFREVLLGHAEVRQTIHVPNVGTIAGSYVQDGKITRNASIRIVRDGIVISEDKIASLRRFKDDVREVAAGYECGVGLDKFNDIKVGDVLEAFVMEEVPR